MARKCTPVSKMGLISVIDLAISEESHRRADLTDAGVGGTG